MKYCKRTDGKYILAVGTNIGGKEITEAEYNRILELIRNAPSAPDGFAYRLTENLEWEKYELPVEEDPELTEAEALDIILGGEG